jgi:hypothetical protein
VADGCFIFGVCRTKYLIGMVHWVQDFARVSEDPSLDLFADNVAFCMALDEAFDRADVRPIEKDQSDTISKAADPERLRTSANGLNGSQRLSITYLQSLE